jgi:hypothetical protein
VNGLYEKQTNFLYRWMEEYGEEIGALGGKIMGWYR